ncbi:nuclease A inhibitor family protein [Brasilonema sp. CT11]|nr:nuclease A inhibitor family protein [Brasilonema sp. CT11]
MSDSSSEITAKLKDASNGLLMPSESEYPFEPLVWSGTELTPKKILELTGHPTDSPVETVALGDLFANLAYEQEWHDNQQKVDVSKFKKFLETLEGNLTDIQVFRIGRIKIDIYIVGKTEAGLVGVKTKVVET